MRLLRVISAFAIECIVAEILAIAILVSVLIFVPGLADGWLRNLVIGLLFVCGAFIVLACAGIVIAKLRGPS